MSEEILFDNLNPFQQSMLDQHLQATQRSSRNCESLRDPLESKYLAEVTTKLYGSLGYGPPAIYILDSPLACAYMWSHTPQSVADRWRVFHDEFYTHPLSSPIVDVITDGFTSTLRLMGGTVSSHMPRHRVTSIEQGYRELERVGDVIATAIGNVEKPLQNSQLLASFHNQVNQYINNPAIQSSVQRQPIPNYDRLLLPADVFRGQHYMTPSFYQALTDLGIPFTGYHKNLVSLYQQMNKAAHWWFPFKNVLIMSDRHKELHVDEVGRPHNLKGPAVEYRDGWKVYAHKGILIPKEIVENPEKITITKILEESNAEIRRVMIDVFGLDRFVVESKSKTLDTQGEYELLEVPYLDDGSMIALKMRCPTTAAVYVHSVHPQCTNVEQALAWKRGEDDFRNARPYKEGLLWEK